MLTENLIKGYLVELKVQEELIRYGFDISVPDYNASRYDIIADTGTELLRFQVKKAIGVNTVKEETFRITCTSQNVRSSTGSKYKYTKNDIDYFATVWKDQVYFIPVEETSDRKTIHVSDTQYYSQNIFKDFKRLSDEELYNFTKVKDS